MFIPDGNAIPYSEVVSLFQKEQVKEFLSKVPNLYVEDAAVASGKFLETRIRSITNDPATALALKNLLVFLKIM